MCGSRLYRSDESEGYREQVRRLVDRGANLKEIRFRVEDEALIYTLRNSSSLVEASRRLGTDKETFYRRKREGRVDFKEHLGKDL